MQAKTMARLVAGATSAGSALYSVWPPAGGSFALPGVSQPELLKFWAPLAGGALFLFPGLVPRQKLIGTALIVLGGGYIAYSAYTSGAPVNAETVLRGYVPAAAAAYLFV